MLQPLTNSGITADFAPLANLISAVVKSWGKKCR